MSFRTNTYLFLAFTVAGEWNLPNPLIYKHFRPPVSLSVIILPIKKALVYVRRIEYTNRRTAKHLRIRDIDTSGESGVEPLGRVPAGAAAKAVADRAGCRLRALRSPRARLNYCRGEPQASKSGYRRSPQE